MKMIRVLLVALALLALACNINFPTSVTQTSAPVPTATGEITLVPSLTATVEQPVATTEITTVMLYFTVSDPLTMHLQSVSRQFPKPEMTSQLIKETLERSLQGPTVAEQAQGLTSWFGPATADALKAVAVDMNGEVKIDFQPLSATIPNASTSAGSLMLLSQLNATLFQFPFVQQIIYMENGSCPAFWEWLQSACHPVTRAEWQAEPTP